MHRFRITAWIVGLIVALGVSVLGAIASSGAATPAHAATANANTAKKKHKKKTSCPKGTKKHGKVCIKTKIKIKVKTKEVPNTTLANEEAAKKKTAEEEAASNKKKAEEEAAAKVKAQGEAAAEKTKAAAEAAGKTKAEAEVLAEKAKVAAEAAAVAAAKTAGEATGKTTGEAAGKKKLEEEIKKKEEEEKKLEEAEKKKEEERIPKELGVGAVEAGATKAIETHTEIPSAPAWTPTQLNAWPTGNWIGPEGGTTGDHFSKLTEINASNVKGLKGDWMTGLDNSATTTAEGYSAEASPTEYAGVLYYITGADDVFAVSAASGKILWVTPGNLPASTNSAVCCGWDARGLSIGEGRVYVPLLSGSVEALNEQTGLLEWKTELGQPSEGLTVTSAPLYYEGMVFVGPVGSEYGVRGFMEAFNAKTGAIAWKHYNIPGEGEVGHETWPTGSNTGLPATATAAEQHVADNEWKHGGATNWNAPTVDPKAGLIEYSTANAGNDNEGYFRKGDNLWTVSMLALNYKTGELAWGYQEIHHDVWDYDASNQPTMINVEVGGKREEGIVQANKDGFAYFVNAETGVPFSATPITEEKVPTNPADASSETQPIPSLPPFYPQKLTEPELVELQKMVTSDVAGIEKTKGAAQPAVEVVHGGYKEDDVFGAWAKAGETKAQVSSDALSGDNEAPSSFDPENGYYYVCSRKGLDYAYITNDEVPVFSEGSDYAGPDYLAAAHIGTQGYLTAYDMKTGTMAWIKEWKHECYSGITTTAGNLLITGTIQGEMLVYNATTGEELLNFQLGATIGGAEAVYEYGGKERIGVYAGGNDFDFGGNVKGDLLWQLSLSGALSAVAEKYYTTHLATANTTTHEAATVPTSTTDY